MKPSNCVRMYWGHNSRRYIRPVADTAGCLPSLAATCSILRRLAHAPVELRVWRFPSPRLQPSRVSPGRFERIAQVPQPFADRAHLCRERRTGSLRVSLNRTQPAGGNGQLSCPTPNVFSRPRGFRPLDSNRPQTIYPCVHHCRPPDPRRASARLRQPSPMHAGEGCGCRAKHGGATSPSSCILLAILTECPVSGRIVRGSIASVCSRAEVMRQV